ncbi:hypothetical protein ACFS07_05400 [Undibacterium arcticum]
MNRRLTPVAAALLAAFSAPLALAQGTPNSLPALSDTQPADAVLSEITVHDSAKKRWLCRNEKAASAASKRPCCATSRNRSP